MDWQEKDHKFIAHTYDRYALTITHGEGCTLYDDRGNHYLDFTSGIGVNLFGHHDKEWIHAVETQLSQLSHSSNLYTNVADVEAAQCLCRKSGCQRVFFANSGAESNEGAIKAARKYSHERYGKDRYEIITLTGSFHGRTLTALSATGQEVFHRHYMPWTPGFVYVNTNDVEDLHRKVSERTCAIMIEVIQGESGVNALEHSFVSEIAEICQKKDILLIVDEVQSGIARCGSLFAYEQYGIQPDIVTCAKALGGGLPLGAVLLYEKVKDVFHYGDHGTTFGGNPIACAGALSVLKRCDEALYHSVREKGAILKERLRHLPHVRQVSGLGFMLGVELDQLKARDVVNSCIEKGVLFLTAKQRLRLLPPLNISDEEMEKGIHVLHEVLACA